MPSRLPKLTGTEAQTLTPFELRERAEEQAARAARKAGPAGAEPETASEPEATGRTWGDIIYTMDLERFQDQVAEAERRARGHRRMSGR